MHSIRPRYDISIFYCLFSSWTWMQITSVPIKSYHNTYEMQIIPTNQPTRVRKNNAVPNTTIVNFSREIKTQKFPLSVSINIWCRESVVSSFSWFNQNLLLSSRYLRRYSLGVLAQGILCVEDHRYYCILRILWDHERELGREDSARIVHERRLEAVQAHDILFMFLGLIPDPTRLPQ